MSAKGAAIGLGETKDIANAVTSAMQAYEKSGLTASRATDILTATVREGKLEAADLAPVIGRVLPLASQLGISFSNLGANIATFTRLGVDADEAVTGLRGVLQALIKETPAGAKALANVGLSYKQLREELKTQGLAQTLLDVKAAFHGNIDEIAKVFSRIRGLTNLLAVTGDQAMTYYQIQNNINNLLGVTDKGFQDVTHTMQFKFQQALANLEKAGTKLGIVFFPLMTKLANLVSTVSDKFSNLSPRVQKIIGIVMSLGIALPPII